MSTRCPTTASQSSAVTERPLGLRQRPDLRIEPHRYGPQPYWLVKDPVAGRYFHLAAEEHAILRMLDGRISLGRLKRRFEETFAPLQITVEQLHAFLGRLHSLGLLIADSFGQGEQLLQRLAAQRRRNRLAVLGNVLAIRFPGVDPDPLLRWLYPKCRWIFAPWFLALGLGMVLAALGLACFQFSLMQSKLPDFHAYLTPRNVVWLLVVLALVKIVHELAHALTCIHVGGQCHEIGLLLLVFTPCLYCDVSDAWSIAGKWRRIAVSAAGIVVEACLAAAATFLWWFSAAGTFHTLCLHVMIVCSVSTLLLNGNPLLRYDGYYVLADWLEVPNLGQQSQALLHRLMAWFFLGSVPPADRSLPQRSRWLLVVYAAAATLYRWLVVLGILWFCYRLAKAYRAEVLAVGLAILVIAGMLAAPAWNLVRFLNQPAVRRGILWTRAWLLTVLVLAAAVVLVTLPLPYRVTAPAVFQPRDARMVYVTVPGRLAAAAGVAVKPGDAVCYGQELAQLVNLDVEREIVELSGQCEQQRLQLRNARLRQIDDPQVAAEIPRDESALADLEARLQQRQQDRESLTLRAPCDGVLLPPPRLPADRDHGYMVPGRQLHAWRGSPLDAQNSGSTLEKGTLFCMVGPPAALEAFVVVDQSDVDFVAIGQKVRLQVDEAPGRIVAGTIVELADLDLKVVPRELAQGSEIPLRVDEKGVPHPLAASYQARVVLDEPPGAPLLPGTRGRAKIVVEPQSLARRLYRFLQRTFSVR
jgi:putative peptide zinc metalloprotease protein